jgi:hypothetical protein
MPGALVFAAGALGIGGALRGFAEIDSARPLDASGLRVSVSAGAEAVEARGLDPAAAAALAGVAPGDPGWRAALAVRAVPAGTPDSVAASLPPVAGRYRVDGDAIRFEPSFELAGPLVLAVRLDPAALARLAGRPAPAASTPTVRRFTLPAPPAPARTTEVVAVHPSADVVPENQLRWYVELSAPMREGAALEHVRLLDARGREVPGAFLVTDEELWDASGRRITLLFDPGRVKRGIRTNVEMGPPLRAGERYTLRIDVGWRDARGAALRAPFEHRFRAGPADRAAPDPARWRVRAPARGGREALVVAFDEPLDHALAEGLLAVVDAAGRPVPGRAHATGGDREWRFEPAVPWSGGAYAVRVSPEIEDPAGNSIARVFDRDVAAGGAAGAVRGATISFRARD